jgi:hypothetical protein
MPVTERLRSGMASINPAVAFDPVHHLRNRDDPRQCRGSLSLALIGHDSITDDTVQHPLGGAAD